MLKKNLNEMKRDARNTLINVEMEVEGEVELELEAL